MPHPRTTRTKRICQAILPALAFALLGGCDSGNETGTQVEKSEVQVKSTQNMADFMKTQGKNAPGSSKRK